MLLDTAVVMMQQYSSLAAVSQQLPTASNTPNGFQSNLPTTGQNIWSSTVPAESPKVAKVAPTTSTQMSSSTEKLDESSLEKPSTSKTEVHEEEEDSTTPLSPEEEIRRRRLQKFQQNTAEQVQN